MEAKVFIQLKVDTTMCDSTTAVKPKQAMACIVCGKTYSSGHFLRKHMAVHKLCPVADANQFSCGYCGVQFDNSSTYIDHMSKVAQNLRDAKSKLLAKRQRIESQQPPPQTMPM